MNINTVVLPADPEAREALTTPALPVQPNHRETVFRTLVFGEHSNEDHFAARKPIKRVKCSRAFFALSECRRSR